MNNETNPFLASHPEILAQTPKRLQKSVARLIGAVEMASIGLERKMEPSWMPNDFSGSCLAVSWLTQSMWAEVRHAASHYLEPSLAGNLRSLGEPRFYYGYACFPKIKPQPESK